MKLDVYNNLLIKLPDDFPATLQDLVIDSTLPLPEKVLHRLISQNTSNHSNSITVSAITEWMKWTSLVDKDSGEYRDIALQRLISCLKNGEKSLDLSGLALTTLPNHIPNSVENLDFHNNQLTTFADNLPDNLKHLDARNNQLISLPTLLPNTLTYLALGNNQLTHLPDYLPDSLRYLNVSGNQLKVLPEQLPDQLVYFNAGNNQLTELPTSLPAGLENLYIHRNKLTFLPDNLPDDLRNIDVHSNWLAVLPDKWPKFLQFLSVSNNKLKTLSNSLPDALQHLNVSGNLLRNLPDHLPNQLKILLVDNNHLSVIADNLPADLNVLDAHNNQLVKIPIYLPYKLISLDLSHNKLTNLLTDLSNNLTTLDVSNNRLSDLPDKLPDKLEKLAAHDNRLTSLPEQLTSSLVSLNVSNNQLDNLPDHLPEKLRYLTANNNHLTLLPVSLPYKIEDLHVRNNQLTYLTNQLPQMLLRLDVSGNQLCLLPINLPHSLLVLDVSNNQLNRLPDKLPPALNTLDAYSNQLSHLPKVLSNELQYINVYNNQIVKLPDQLPQGLIKLDVSNNQLASIPTDLPNTLKEIIFNNNPVFDKLISLPNKFTLTASSGDADTIASDRNVSDWKISPIHFDNEGESSRFDGQLIIQLENDPIVTEAALQLLKKHPQISVLIQLDSHGNSYVVYGNTKGLREQAKLRWQLVGHGRDNQLDGDQVSLAWREPKPLALQLKQLVADLGMTVSPKHINLVGCSLADDKQQTGYVQQFAEALDETIRPYSVSTYSSKLIVNDEGRKRLMEAGNKTTLLFNHETNDWHIEKTAAKTVDSRIKNGMEKSTLGDPLGLGSVSYKFLSFIKLAEQFQSTMIQFYHYHQLSLQKWLPLFTSFSKSKTQPGSYVLQFIHQETHLLKKLIINNKYIIDFINKYNEYLAIVSKAYHYNGKTLALRDNITDAEGVHGLNAAFLIKELIPWFANNHRFGVVDNELSETLSTAINIHAYLNLTQIAHGTVEDTLKLASLYHMAVNQGKQATKGLLGEVFHFHRATDFILNFSSIALDSIELANAQNDLQRAVFSAQLGVDSTNLAVAGVGIGAWMAGAQTTAAFTGALSVPLAGLGIGVSALAEAFGKVTHNVQIVGNYFADVDLAYKQGGYRQIKKKIADSDAVIIMEPIPGAVITELDLRQNKLTFDSQYLYRNDPTYSSGSGHSNYFLFWPNRGVNRDKSQAINIRQGLGYQSSQSNFKPGDDVLILPGTPITYLDYAYMILPFVTTRDDRGFDLLRKLEQDGRFDFDFYAFPGERAIYKIIPDYVSTPIKVILDDRDRELVLPALPIDFQRYMSYQLIGGEGEYRISLAKGVPITLVSNHANTRWVLDARYLKSGTNMQVSEEGDYLYIDNVIVTLPKNASQISVINKEGIFVFDEKSQQMHIIHMDAMRFNNNNSLDEYLKMLANIQEHPTPFVIIDHYQPDNAVGQVGRAYYETARSRMIYTNRPGEAEFLSQAVLAKVDGDKAWFYRDTAIWQVEISSGKIIKQYQPFSFATESHDMIRSYTIQGNGQLLFVIEQGKNMRSVYIVEDTALKLVAINNDQRLLAILDEMKKPVDFIIEDHNSGQLLAERNKIPFLALDTRYELV
ncbi:MAG TPA: TcdA/TcdB pore-forming domain-containing protein [Arsenophonus nasoniae]|uniref:TcdA/TcdB pore-forming domain-containing protein n=2 Tax=Arsenophonus nasoniae TaxID=638 RepID=UPI0038799738